MICQVYFLGLRGAVEIAKAKSIMYLHSNINAWIDDDIQDIKGANSPHSESRCCAVRACTIRFIEHLMQKTWPYFKGLHDCGSIPKVPVTFALVRLISDLMGSHQRCDLSHRERGLKRTSPESSHGRKRFSEGRREGRTGLAWQPAALAEGRTDAS